MLNVKQCLRSLKRSPVFTFVSLLLLTAGVASNVAVFSTLDALFLRPLPIKDPGTLVRVASLTKDGHAGSLPSTMLEALRGRRAFRGVCGMDTGFQAAEVAGSVRQVGEAWFSGGCFETLGLKLQLGRGITPADDQPNAAPVAVITDSLWREAYAGRPDALGQTIRVDKTLFTIIGVTEKRFSGLLLGFPEPVMIPLKRDSEELPNGARPTYWWVNIFGRLAPGVSLTEARAAIEAGQRQLLEESLPPHYEAQRRRNFLEMKLALQPAGNGLDYFLRDRFGEYVYAIFGLCLAVLLLTCLNMVSLLFARSLRRRQEVTVRLALGAKRGHIAGMLVMENAALLMGGIACGVVAGLWAADAIVASWGEMFGNFELQIGMDLRVILFLIAAIVVVFAIFSAASVWQAGRLANAETLRQNGRGVIGQNTRAQQALLVAQIAVTLTLVSGATLFGVSLRNMYTIHFGIRPQNVWSVLLTQRPGGYRNFEPGPYYRDLIAQIESLPGVVSASISRDVPFFYGAYKDPVQAVDIARRSGEIQADVRPVTDRYFETMGAKVEIGEDFRRADDGHRELQVIISKSLAERLGNPHDLVGHHMRIGTDSKYQHARIIGVASDMDMNLANLNDRRPFTVFTDLWQDRNEQRYPVLMIRTAGNRLDPAAIRRIVNRGGREFVERFATVSADIDGALIENRFLAYLAGIFSAIALVIAAVGIVRADQLSGLEPHV